MMGGDCINENLIFDIGFHKGEDTYYYLLKGYKVVAVDADPELIEEWRNIFKKYIDNGKLILLNYVISDKNDVDAEFYISSNTLWSSTKVSVSSRMHCQTFKKRIKSKRIDYLLQEYGIPFYCKIDIEGNDIIALKTMEKVSVKPLYISVETECVGENEDIAGHELDTLNALYELGYKKFKLVDQRTLSVLGYDCFYRNIPDHHWSEQMQTNCHYAKEQIDLSDVYQYAKFTDFFPGSSGPFGEELVGKWYDYIQAKEILMRHREDKMKLNEPEWNFWCDWHATF